MVPKKAEKSRRSVSENAGKNDVAANGEARRPILGGVDGGLGALLLFGIWAGLPARWWPVDVLGSALALAFVAAGVGLYRGTPWARKVAIGVASVALCCGGLLVAALALTASHLAGLYGPVGQGGALLIVFVALLLLPYLVFVPAAQLYLLARPNERPGSERR